MYKTITVNIVKFSLGGGGGSVTRFFASGFFHESVSPQPQSIPLGPFRICGDIGMSRCTTGSNDIGGKFAAGIYDTQRQNCCRYQ
jgi:hypothetical protein